MKTALIVIGFLVVLVTADDDCPLKKAFMKSLEECKESMNPSEETLELLMKKEGMDNRDVQCFQACVTEKAGIRDGVNIDVDKMEALMRSAENPNDEKIKAIVVVMNACKAEAEVSDDACVVTGNYMKCFKEKIDAAKAAQ